MIKEYNPHDIEARWQARWAAAGRGTIDLDHAACPFYNLMEFPYPSGEGLHVGHVFSFGGADTYGRFMRRCGYEVFQPIGYDAFGIHSENYALKVGAHPHDLTPRAIARFRTQLRRLGAAFDWSREVDTTDPRYYRWTQWIFTRLYKAGLAYRAAALVNWCPSCKTVLANEQVVEGCCERCDTPMAQREMTQWFLRITQYAERLLDFSQVDFAPAVIKRQQAWIGRSAGAEIDFQIADFSLPIDASELQSAITVFTTRPDTIFGATFVVLAPEHPLVAHIIAAGGPQAADVRAYAEQAARRLELERQQSAPTGVFSSWYAINPANGERLPVWVADYVLASYGTGAIMGVPAHDDRDRRFAEAYNLPIGNDRVPPADDQRVRFDDQGVQVYTNGQWSLVGRRVVRYRLRDWLISRQRYWGPPIPIVYCAACGTVPMPDEQLPVLLPPLAEFRPTGAGVSPLATVAEWVNTTCPQCGGPATRETEVSDNFLDSAWYFMRYTTTERDDVAWDVARLARWLPVDMYTGGPEHATMHHLYARFISMALHDLGLSPVAEPFARLRLHGTITRAGRKMSKSRGNVVNPDEYIAHYGADATRMALQFLGPFDEDADFSDRSVVGMARFLLRVWELCTDRRHLATDDALLRAAGDPDVPDVHGQWSVIGGRFVARVTESLAARRFHTAIAALMEYANWLRGAEALPPAAAAEARYTLVSLLAPFAPHIAEELWVRLGGTGSVHDAPWPAAQTQAEHMHELAVQVDGRVRARISVAATDDDAAVRAKAVAAAAVQVALAGRPVQRVIVVPGRIVNIVTG
jgi:leucyl-tRNA synthetase